MPGEVYKKVNGKWSWFNKESGAEISKSAFIHQDTMKVPLRHPVTGRKMDSMTQWNRTNERLGLECVGNDLLSNRKREVKDKVTDEMILDRIEKAESILNDPAKYRAYKNREAEKLAMHDKMFEGKHRY